MPHPAATPTELGTDDELPEGWVAATLPTVFHLNPPKAKGADYHDDLPVTFVPMPAVDALTGTIRTPTVRNFGVVKKGFTSFRDGDVILAKITPCMENGKAAVVGGMLNGLGFGSTEFHVFRPTGAVLSEYLFHFLRQESFRRNAADEMTGSVGQKRVPAEFLTGIELTVPPLAEQRRIVAAVGRILDKVSSARARLDRVPTTLKRFRQAVLAAACSGRLTADWRKSHDTADCHARDWVASIHDIRQQTLQGRKLNKLGTPVIETLANHELADWATTRIGDVTECLDHLRVPVRRDERGKDGSIPYYGANGQSGWIEKHLFDEELVLVVEDETFVGREIPFSYIIRGKSWVNNHAHILRPLGTMQADFLNVVLARYDFVPLTSGTTGRRKLIQAALISAPIHVPPLAEQQEIVRRVSALFAHADAIESRTAAARKRVDALTQAVLAKAFRGELVPTEAELARRDNRLYEPAADLLARFRASAGPVTKVTRGRKPKGSSRS